MWFISSLILIVFLLLILFRPRGMPGIWTWLRRKTEFYSKGADNGFSMAEIKLLWSAVRHTDLPNPAVLYGSGDALDKVLNEIAGDRPFLSRDLSETETRLLKKMFAYRNKVEMSRPRYQSGLINTYSLPPGQPLTIRVDGVGLFASTVVKNEEKYLTITIPVGTQLPKGFSWRTAQLNVYFWRKNDAGYFFQTKLFERFYDLSNLHHKIYHRQNILRSQKRRSVRAPVAIPARLIPLRHHDEETAKNSFSLNCTITDLSEDGAALSINTWGKEDQLFRLQFKIREELVALTGQVKWVSIQSGDTVLHTEFYSPTETQRMLLLSCVFDIDRSRARKKKAESASMGQMGQFPFGKKDKTVEGKIPAVAEQPKEVAPEPESAGAAENP